MDVECSCARAIDSYSTVALTYYKYNLESFQNLVLYIYVQITIHNDDECSCLANVHTHIHTHSPDIHSEFETDIRHDAKGGLNYILLHLTIFQLRKRLSTTFFFFHSALFSLSRHNPKKSYERLMCCYSGTHFQTSNSFIRISMDMYLFGER